jgi:hypothetical protein
LRPFIERLDLLAKPAAHLRSRIAERDAINIIGPIELIQQVEAAAIGEPCVHLARVKSKRNGRSECKRLILADVIVGGAVPHLHGAVRYRIEHLKGRHDFTRAEDADLEFLVGKFGYRPAEHLARTIKRIEVLREGGGEPPPQSGTRLRDSGRANCAGRGGKTYSLQKFSAIHGQSPVGVGCKRES